MSHNTRREPSSYTRTICDEAGCEFYGENVVQGVCHTTDGEVCDLDRLDTQERELNEFLDDLRSRSTAEEYVEHLEANYVCSQVNWTMTLDECVRLRRDNSLLRKRLSKLEP